VYKTGRMHMAGHRGASYTAPENTLAANRVAFEQGADGVEFDVHLSGDGVIFLLHDYTLSKTASKTCPETLCFEGGMSQSEYLAKLEQQVSTLSYVDFIRHVDVGSSKGPEWSAERPATLVEAMRAIPDNKFALCELKGSSTQLAFELASLVTQEGWPASKFHVIGFSLEAMVEVKRHLVEQGRRDHMVWWVKVARNDNEALADIETTVAAGLDGIDLLGGTKGMKDVVHVAKSRGLEVAVWVSAKVPWSDTVENVERMVDSDVDIFTSNIPPPIQKWILDRR